MLYHFAMGVLFLGSAGCLAISHLAEAGAEWFVSAMDALERRRR